MRTEVLHMDTGGVPPDLDWGGRFLTAYGEVREVLGALAAEVDLAGVPVGELETHVQLRVGGALDPLRSRLDPARGVIRDFRVLLAETPDGAIAATADIWPTASAAYGRVTVWLRGGPPT